MRALYYSATLLTLSGGDTNAYGEQTAAPRPKKEAA
jgi:hypothetical protein